MSKIVQVKSSLTEDHGKNWTWYWLQGQPCSLCAALKPMSSRTYHGNRRNYTKHYETHAPGEMHHLWPFQRRRQRPSQVSTLQTPTSSILHLSIFPTKEVTQSQHISTLSAVSIEDALPPLNHKTWRSQENWISASIVSCGRGKPKLPTWSKVPKQKLQSHQKDSPVRKLQDSSSKSQNIVIQCHTLFMDVYGLS